jgi:hypothetical protein
METIRKLTVLTYLNLEDKALGALASLIAYAHWRSTPLSPSQSTLDDIILESLVRLERKVELARHTNFRRSMEAIGKDYRDYE